MYLPVQNISPSSTLSASLERSPSDLERARDLARIKIIATTLLAFSVVVAFVARFLESRYATLGYVAAWAEAAAVGGLADWYAVVALFRHPCGIPLPHTAIISNNRERIAESFGDFVEEQFLAPDPIEQKLRSVDFAAAVADWLADEERSLSLSRFALRLLPQALFAIEETGLQSFVSGFIHEAQNDPDHALRGDFDRFVREFVEKLGSSPEYADKAETLKQELVARPEVRALAEDLWVSVKRFLVKDARSGNSILELHLARFLADLGRKLAQEPRLRAEINAGMVNVLQAFVQSQKREIARFITDQIRSWELAQMVNIIELNISRDLQYIRLNGTFIGGLAGLALYAGGHALGLR